MSWAIVLQEDGMGNSTLQAPTRSHQLNLWGRKEETHFGPISKPHSPVLSIMKFLSISVFHSQCPCPVSISQVGSEHRGQMEWADWPL